MSDDVHEFQRRMEEMQRNNEVLDAYSRIVSGGKSSYKAVIEKKKITLRCKNCTTILEDNQKFCHECGMKVERPTQ